MSTFKKMLVLLLTATLLVGTLCVVASADEAPTKVQYSDRSTDYEGAVFDYNANLGTGDPKPALVENGMGSRGGHLTSTTSGGNTYLRFWNKKGEKYASPNSTTSYFGLTGKFNSEIWSAAFYEYVTTDFDIRAEHYVDENGDTASSGTLSYAPNSFIEYKARGQIGTTSSYPGAEVRFYFQVDEDGDWCLTYTPAKVGDTQPAKQWYKLAKNAGEWNHITFLFDIDNTPIYNDYGLVEGWTLSKSDLYVYIDGNLAFVANDCVNEKCNTELTMYTETGTYTKFGFDQVRFNFPLGNIGKDEGISTCDVAIGIDNIDTNYYQNGYTGGLDEVISDPTKSICDAYDSALSGNYQMPYPNKPICEVDGVGYFFEGSATKAIKANSEIDIYRDFTRKYYVNFPFTVKTNGYSFDFTTTSYEKQETEGYYHFVKSTDPVQIIFDGDPENTEIRGFLYDDTSVSVVGGIPRYPKELPIYHYVAEEELLYKFIGWTNEKGGNVPLEVLPTLTMEDVYYGVYYLYPVYEKVECAYFVTVNGVKTGYLSYDTLSEHLKTDGAVIDFAHKYDKPDEILSIENNVTLNAGDNTVKYYSTTKIADITDGTYVFRDVLASEFVNLNWSFYDGAVLMTQKEIPGNTIADITVCNKNVEEYYYDRVTNTKTVFEFTGEWTAENHSGVAVPHIYTVPRSALENHNVYPVYQKLDSKYFTLIDGVETGYHTFDDFTAYLAIDGAKITLNDDYGRFIYLENAITLDVGEYAVEYYSETMIADVEGSVYTFRPVTDADYVTVNWVDLNGEIVFSKENQIPGNTISTPNIDNKIPGNIDPSASTDVYRVYLNWERTVLVNKENNDNRPTNAEDAFLELYIVGLKYNLSALSYFKLNVYVPKPQDDKVVVNYPGAVDCVIDGKDYVMLPNMASINADNINSVAVDVSLEVNGVVQSQRLEISLPEYFRSVLARDGASDVEKQLIAAAVNYCNEAYKLCSGTSSAEYDAIVAEYADFFESVNTVIKAEESQTGVNSTVQKYVSGITLYYTTDDFKPTFAFVASNPAADGQGSVPAPYMNYDGTNLQDGQYGICIEDNSGVFQFEYGTQLVEVKNGDSTTYYFIPVDENGENLMPVYSLNDVFKFRIRYKAGGVIKNGAINRKYSLATYIHSVEAAGGDASLGRALYALAYAADNYNTALGKTDDTLIINGK